MGFNDCDRVGHCEYQHRHAGPCSFQEADEQLLAALAALVGSTLYGALPADRREEFRPLFDAARDAIAKAEGRLP